MTDLPDLVTPIYEQAKRKIKRVPCHTNRASQLGGDCERELVYARTHWEEAVLHDVKSQIVFSEGDLQESKVLRDMSAAGIDVIEQQTTLEWKPYQLTGHVDGVIVVEGKSVPMDIKSMHPMIWDQVAKRGPGVYQWEEVSEAFAKKHWLRKYKAQLQLYMLFKGTDQGILYCKNKSTGALAQINMELDLDYADSLIQRAERINIHVQEGTLPNRIPFGDFDGACSRCRFLHICLPDMVDKDPIAFLDDGVVEALLHQLEEHKDDRDAYERADKTFKGWAKAQEWNKATVGDYMITVKRGEKQTRVTWERLAEVEV